MTFLAGALPMLAGGLFGSKIIKAVLGGGKKAPVQPLPQASRDDAAAAIARDDELRRRKGAAADILTGSGGAEATGTPGKFILGN